jgi:Fic family protein
LTIGGSNGRLARAITGRLLAQGYCTALERCQRGDLDVTAWLSWFLEQLSAAAASHGALVDAMQRKAISLTKVS